MIDSHASSRALALRGLSFSLQEPWLVLGAVFAAMGSALLFLSFCWQHPWLPFFGIALVCLFVHILRIILLRGGLLPLLPDRMKPILYQPFFISFQSCVQTLINYGCNALRVVLLASMELSEEEKKDILESLDPEFRSAVFQKPFLQALPDTAQRILLGTNVRVERMKAEHDIKQKTSYSKHGAVPSILIPTSEKQSRRQRHVPQFSPLHSGRQWSPQGSEPERVRADSQASSDLPVRNLFGNGDRARTHSGDASEVSSKVSTSSKRSLSMHALIDIVRGMESSQGHTHINATVSSLHHVVKNKTASTAVFAARSLVASAQRQVHEVVSFGFTKVCEFVDGVSEAAADRTNQVTAASAVGGAMTLAAGGGVAGVVSGGIIGAVCGVVPAVFTFGLSIPIGAVVGSGAGLIVGTTVGGTTGFVGGGAMAYYLNSGQEACDAQSIESDTDASSDMFVQ